MLWGEDCSPCTSTRKESSEHISFTNLSSSCFVHNRRALRRIHLYKILRSYSTSKQGTSFWGAFSPSFWKEKISVKKKVINLNFQAFSPSDFCKENISLRKIFRNRHFLPVVPPDFWKVGSNVKKLKFITQNQKFMVLRNFFGEIDDIQIFSSKFSIFLIFLW